MDALKKNIYLTLVLCSFANSSAFADLIPGERLINWTSNVGVEGGIPNRTTEVDCTAPPYNARANGANTQSQIQACLNGISANQVAYLPAGTYTLNNTLSIPSNKTLRGASPASTILSYPQSLTNNVQFNGGYTDVDVVTGIDILSGLSKDSTWLTLANVSGLATDDIIYISELNDPSIPVVFSNNNGACNYCGVYGSGGTRSRLQMTRIKSVDTANRRLELDMPMFHTFSSNLSPQVHRAPRSYVVYAGIENLTIRNEGTSTSSTRKMILMQGAANCWVKNVQMDTCGKRCIDFWFDNYRNEVRDNYFTNCLDRQNSDTCYPMQIEAGSGNLVENNIFYNTANGVILVSASGNVIGYNYMHNVHRTDNLSTWMWPDNWTHGSHSTYNLWEGNNTIALEWDYYWGSNSHNLAYRNRFRGMDETVAYNLNSLQTVGAILTYPHQNFMTEVGNVLGTSGFHTKYKETVYQAVGRPIYADILSAFGTSTTKSFDTKLRHMNYDYFNNAVKFCGTTGEPPCQGGDGSTNLNDLRDSFYLAGKPAWFGTVAWPPIGPDVSGLYNKIPAQLCYENGAKDGTGHLTNFNAKNCYGTGGPSDTLSPSAPVNLRLKQ